jgi:hypothetical protein
MYHLVYKKVRLLVITLLLMWLPTGFFNAVLAQTLQYSRPQSLSGRITDFDVLGETVEGILLLKWGERQQIIEAYDPISLDLRWRKELQFEHKRLQVVQANLTAEGNVLLFFTTTQRKNKILHACLMRPDVLPIIRDVAIDTALMRFGITPTRYEITVSQNKQHFAIIRSNYSFSGLDNVEVLTIDPANLTLLQRQTTTIPEKYEFLEVFANNKGTVFLTKAQVRHTILDDTRQYNNLQLAIFEPAGPKKEIEIEKGDYQLTDIRFKPDNKNNRLVAAGFYSEKNQNYSNGYFYMFIDFDNYTLSQKIFMPFKTDRINDIRDKISVKYRDRGKIYSLAIKDLVLRNDGGVLLVGESFFTSQQNLPRSTFDNYYSRQSITITSYYYEDIFIFSINPDGSELWDQVLFKKQYSEKDGGYYSSFGVVNTRKNLQLLFNEDINSTTNLNSYQLTYKGDYKVLTLLNTRERSLTIAPRYVRQISDSEAILPAFTNRNELLLVKATFNSP